MATFVLVHSMWHGAWSFDRLRAKLEAAGHRVLAEDLAGCSLDQTPLSEATLDRWVEDTARLVESAGEKVVLVGHSRGGFVVSQTAEKVPDCIIAAVYVAALMLPNGKSGLDLPIIGAAFGDPAVIPRFNAEGTGMLAPEDAAQSIYGDCSEADRAEALPRLGPEPFAPMMQALALSDERYGRVPRFYIKCLQDKVLVPEMQQTLIELSPGTQMIPLDAGHMPTLTHTDELVAILEKIATH